MEPSDVIVVGASAGGVEALREFVRGIPEDATAAVLVVLHMPPRGVSALPAILRRAAGLPVEAARSGSRLCGGRIYTAVPDHHLLVLDGRIVLSHGPTENGHRPGVDALFRSAALAWGPRTAGVVMSGSLDDGTAGLSMIKARGGLAAVQDPKEALYRSMPESAMAQVRVDLALPAAELGAAVMRLLRVRPHRPEPPPPAELDRLELDMDAGRHVVHDRIATSAEPSGLTCPDCSGPLFTMAGGVRYRCLVGHAWTAEALLVEQSVEVEKALWTAVRALDEKARLADRMAADAEHRGDDLIAHRFADQRGEHAHAAEVLRKLLVERRAERSER
ncbi:chemotaxis protein CheB [Nocardia otitidiscaviarum]|uniref:chemotaxis protein CheB n=1 Tax=Nocardia otitidiscaviarum TaxID=1823 RepID=UPI001893C12D|nr:chemotaxis protein CheB [Nocardia otitidiscaviarum]MBF6235620.1 chemotaxis protein CheB [Nocardia otitidiscaviarum]